MTMSGTGVDVDAKPKAEITKRIGHWLIGIAICIGIGIAIGHCRLVTVLNDSCRLAIVRNRLSLVGRLSVVCLS